MLFMQPVVVNDAAAVERAVPAEVRMAEPRAAEQQAPWNGALFAQSSLDSRSPFGANATDRNDVAPPAPAPHTPTDAVAPPRAPNGALKPASTPNPDVPSPQMSGQTDAGPPVAATPPSTVTPDTAAPGSASIGGGTGASTGTQGPSKPNPSTTLPGGSSGASNSR